MNTAQSNERPMSVDQRKMIFALYRDCGIGDELRHDVQHGVAGKTSLTDFTSHDAARLIGHLEHLQKQSLTSPPKKAGIPGVTSGSVPAPKLVPVKAGNQTRGKHDYITKVHKLPSPEQLAVLDHLYTFAGYTSEDTQRAFADRIEKHPRPRSMWEAEELIFALVAQAAPRMLEEVRFMVDFPLTKFEWGFLFENRAEFGSRGQIPGTFNNARVELEEYLRNKNKRGHRTMPRFSLTKFFEIVGKYK